jgi:predicted dehydrogenase
MVARHPAGGNRAGVIAAAIVGFGRWGKSLMTAAAKSQRLGFAKAVDDAPGFAGVLEDPAIQAVVLATPHSLHREQVLAAAAAGKHVFCEKPLALSLADARAMIDACKRADVRLAVGHNRRFWPAMRALKEVVDDGRLGRVLHIEGHNSNENSNRVAAGWRTDERESPGGGFTGAGLHALDAMVSLCGPVRRVRAQLVRTREELPPLDAMAALYEFENGASGLLATVRATPFYWRVHAFGSEGSAEVLGETELVLRLSGQPAQSLKLEPADSLRAELEAFADAIEGRAPYPIGEAQMLAVMGAFEATLRAL